MPEYHVECMRCGARYERDDVVYTCECGGLLDVKYEYSTVDAASITRGGELGVWKYRALLPFEDGVLKLKGEGGTLAPVTTREGNTPLYRCERLAEKLGMRELYVKHEGLNPTGSFKDRGMTVGVTKALELKMTRVACASTGNTSASLAIYAARAGIPCFVLLPKGKVALGKVAQAVMHGARVVAIDGNFDDALRIVRELCEELRIYLLNSVNPYRLEGQKTIAFEIAEQLGWRAPDRVVLPVGNAGNISAIYKGFCELRELGILGEVPKMTGIQADGARPIVDAIKEGRAEITPEPQPETIASAIRIGNPVNAPKALRAIRESGGVAEAVTDAEIIEAQKELARLEGIGVEPASAASLAGLKKLLEQGVVEKDETVVCVTTGHLLKDPEAVLKACEPPVEVEADADAVRKLLIAHTSLRR
ncbi:MAG TPA: threonine synthase [Methanomicrobia archaeon]|nr:threonine synthase [Methanomicrobia archaeon]HEX58841.1 threonine synthase [Methanomicrobia archaeon]